MDSRSHPPLVLAAPSSSVSNSSLSWALVIATYKRGHILPRCLRLAVTQTRPPREVIVVDASPEWEQTKAVVGQEFATLCPDIPLIYEKAVFASLTAQRNQGINLASADVLFLIDDDSLMYPDCAEAVMKIYEVDRDEAVKGVSAVDVPDPPDIEDLALAEAQTGVGSVSLSSLRSFLKSVLATDQTYFLPYDSAYPDRPIPEHLYTCNIGRSQVMVGFAMTFRRTILLQEKFSEILQRYAAGEDQDLSYRVSRQGALVNALDARVCHLEVSSGRLSLFTTTVLAALNPAVLQQFHSSDLQQTNQQWQRILWRRFLIGSLKDLSERRWGLPRGRGVLCALLNLGTIYSKPSSELQQWYLQFQANLIARNQS